MKKKFIIATASGWYWVAYDKHNNQMAQVLYSIYNTREECEADIPKAFNCRNIGGHHLTILEIYVP